MAASRYKFADLLTKAVHRIKIREHKKIAIIQDELGYALGKTGGSYIEYLRKDNTPSKQDDLKTLTRELVRRGGLTSQAELKQFVRSAGYPHLAEELGPELFPEKPSLPTREPIKPPSSQPIENLAPFLVGVPIAHPRQFFGRQYELKRIFGLLKRFPLQNVAVIGSRCSGKTSLLRYIEEITTVSPAHLRANQRHDWLPQPATYRWLLVDFRDARMRTRQGLMQYILTALEMPVPASLELGDFLDLISEHLRSPTVILMDEIGAGLASPELDQAFWWSLRSLSSIQTKGKLAFILTSSALPSQLAEEHGKPSPFFNMFGHTLRLGPLTEREARELIANSPKAFPNADVEWILTNSGRCPCLLQILCYERWMALEEGGRSDNWKEKGLACMAQFGHLLAEE